MMGYKIAVLPGEGVGPEIVEQGLKALRAAAERFHLDVELLRAPTGDEAIRISGSSLTEAMLDMCRQCDAVLFGAGGGPIGTDAYRQINPRHPNLRSSLGLSFNLRPVWALEPLLEAAWLKPSVVKGADYVVIREMVGGIGYGYRRGLWKTPAGMRRAVNTIRYTEEEVTAHLRLCFGLARDRRRKLALVLQDNVVETSQLWRQIGIELAAQYPDVEVTHLVPDNFAHLLLRQPTAFDVVVIDHRHMAGMINDQGAAIMGSLGMPPSGALRPHPKRGLTRVFGMYEPIHGSVPHRAGKDQVNPIGTVLSVAMLFRHSLGLEEVARAIEEAVVRAVREHRTYDIWCEGRTQVGTSRMGDVIAEEVLRG